MTLIPLPLSSASITLEEKFQILVWPVFCNLRILEKVLRFRSPDPEHYINSVLPTPSVQSQALAAIQNGYSWLMYELNQDSKGLPLEETVKHHGLLEMGSRVAQSSFQPIRADHEEQLRKQREEMARVGQAREMPFERIHNYIKDYLAFPQRSMFYKEMADMQNLLTSQTRKYTHTFIRDFLIFPEPNYLYWMGTTVPRLSTTFSSGTSPLLKYMRQVGEGTTWRCAYMYDHKTSSQGAAIISFNDPLFRLLLGFIRYVRPLFKGGNDPYEHLFMTFHGGEFTRVPSSVIEIF